MYMGKLIGTLAGVVTGRWWLALAGLVLGHQFDRGYVRRATSAGALSAPLREVLFVALGAVAKADGVVRQSEIDAARKLMHRLGLVNGDVDTAIAAFRRGKSSSLDIGALVADTVASARPAAETRSLMLRLLLSATLEGGSMSKPVRAKLWQIAQALDIGRVELVQIEALLRAEAGVGEARAERAAESELDAAYKTLELPSTASDRDVKKAYRRMINRHHPDKLEGKGASGAAVAEAEARSRDIIRAYEAIRRRRGIR